MEELPDFVTGLVGIAMRGRSLGVHLILATQRPSGVVSPEIRANTNLRIALRVTDDAESTDVIDARDAARIAKRTPGRAYARTGYSSLTAFQAGRVGGRRPGAVHGSAAGVRRRGRLGPAGRADRAAAGRRRRLDHGDRPAGAGRARSGAAAGAAGVPRYRSPWLPALGEQIALDAVPAPSRPRRRPGDPSGRVPVIPFGVEDLPEIQAQVPLVIDLEHGSHLVIAGAPRSGRSTALRTIAGSIAAAHQLPATSTCTCWTAATPRCSRSPSCRTAARWSAGDQVDRTDRLLTVLINEITRRQVLLAQHGYGSLAEQRAAAPPDERLPYLVLLLDRWEGFMASFDELDGGRLTQNVLRILREGPSVGLRAVVAGDRSALLGRLPTTIEDKLVLRMGDRNDYGLAGLQSRKMPDSMPPGRAFRNDSMIETHVALLDPDPSGPAQVRALAALARAGTGAGRGRCRAHCRPARVDVLPARISCARCWRWPASPDRRRRCGRWSVSAATSCGPLGRGPGRRRARIRDRRPGPVRPVDRAADGRRLAAGGRQRAGAGDAAAVPAAGDGGQRRGARRAHRHAHRAGPVRAAGPGARPGGGGRGRRRAARRLTVRGRRSRRCSGRAGTGSGRWSSPAPPASW